jgi:predicted DCC family thiol-disulfide oxidoreductase YuxK
VDPDSAPAALVFYDGVCGLCTRFNQFLLPRDRRGRLRFATLQGGLAGRILPRYGKDPLDLDTVYVLADWNTPAERLLSRSAAVLFAVSQLGGAWTFAARIGALVPRVLADAVYGFVARRRYRIFGELESCTIPRPEWRTRFVDEDHAGDD